MNPQDILSVVSIAISTILSVGATILSIWFYKESNKQNKETALLQTEIKNAIEKLEQLYSKMYTDTFGALNTQIQAMQKHIFKPEETVGDTSILEPNNLMFSVLGCITEKKELTLDALCEEIKGASNTEIREMVLKIYADKRINFDGKKISFKGTDKIGLVAGYDTKEKG